MMTKRQLREENIHLSDEVDRLLREATHDAETISLLDAEATSLREELDSTRTKLGLTLDLVAELVAEIVTRDGVTDLTEPPAGG